MATEADNIGVLYEIHTIAMNFYRNYLHSAKAKTAWQYLQGRGFTKKTIREFALGAASDQWDGLYRYLKRKGFSDDDLLDSGLVANSKNGRYYDRFRSRIMFPICNIAGQVIGFTGRLYEETDGQPKYLNSSETAIFKKRDHLYGLHLAAQWCCNVLILVEGTMDVIMLNQARFCNVAAPLGTALTEEQLQLISQHTKELIICFDGDTVGMAATRKALSMATNIGLNVRAVTLPYGKDPMELIQKQGADNFSDLLLSAHKPIAYEIAAAEQACPITDDESLIRYLQTAAQILAKETSALVVDVHAGTIARKYGISKDVMLSEIKSYRRKFNEKKDS